MAIFQIRNISSVTLGPSSTSCPMSAKFIQVPNSIQFLNCFTNLEFIIQNHVKKHSLISGWIMRVYLEMESGDSAGNLKLKELFDGYPFVDLCNVTRVLELRNITNPIFPDSWRFLPLFDPLVDRMLSRDTDNIVITRELVAVNQWLKNSPATFHLMHDHPLHCWAKFLGCKLYHIKF